MISRRSLFKNFVAIVIGGAAAAHVPINWIPVDYQNRVASAFLTKKFNDYCKGMGGAKHIPSLIDVSHELFTAFKSELQSLQRFTSEDARRGHNYLLFKTSKLRVNANLKGYDIIMYNKDEADMELTNEAITGRKKAEVRWAEEDRSLRSRSAG